MSVKQALEETGIETQPGPPGQTTGDARYTGGSKDYILLDIMNPGAVSTNLLTISDRPADFIAVSEHSVGPKAIRSVTKQLAEYGWDAEFSPLIPGRRANSGGVALLA